MVHKPDSAKEPFLAHLSAGHTVTKTDRVSGLRGLEAPTLRTPCPKEEMPGARELAPGRSVLCVCRAVAAEHRTRRQKEPSLRRHLDGTHGVRVLLGAALAEQLKIRIRSRNGYGVTQSVQAGHGYMNDGQCDPNYLALAFKVLNKARRNKG